MAKKKICKLREHEDLFWTRKFERALESNPPMKADKIAFKELVKKYPRLKGCDKIK